MILGSSLFEPHRYDRDCLVSGESMNEVLNKRQSFQGRQSNLKQLPLLKTSDTLSSSAHTHFPVYRGHRQPTNHVEIIKHASSYRMWR